jgi:hypothetical protein
MLLKMSSILKQIYSLYLTPWSLKTVTKHDESKWFAQNLARRRRSLSRLERDLLFAGEHPLRFAISLLTLQVALLVLISLLPPDWFVPTWSFDWKAAEQLAHFSTVWTIQATLAALVYPIVISFIAVYLQRRPAAEAFVHLYMLDSGAIAAGLSSLALVVVMGVQYLMLSTWGTESLPHWALIDTAWFVLNAALTTFFLFRTVEFLRPEVQASVIQRYAVNVALTREVQRLNAFQVLTGSIAKRWFPVPSYGDDNAPEGPRLLIGQYGFREGDVQGEIPLQAQVRLVDIRLWLVRLVVVAWYRKALTWSSPEKTKSFGEKKSWPLLTIPMSPGSTYEGNFPLARVADGPALSGWQRQLLRLSVALRRTSRERYGIRVAAILDELAADARSTAGRSDNEGFERAYSALIKLHGLLLAACLDKTESGEQGSWALLRDTEKLFGRSLHENWSETYRGVFQSAIDSMVREPQPLRRLCHLLQHLDRDEIRASPVEIRENLLHLPPLMMYQLSNWWAFRVEEQGIIEHSHMQMVVLRPPLNRVYEDVLATFVAGWENGRPDTPKRRGKQTVEWAAMPTLARLNVKHIEETARMLLAAVLRGDQAAAEWLADVLSKWWGTLDFDHEPYQLYDKTAFITIDDLALQWSAFCAKFGLLSGDDRVDEQLRPTLQQGAFQAALRNYWTDVRLLSIELMLDWVRTVPIATAGNSLAFEIGYGLLVGKQWKSGSHSVDLLGDLSPPEYLVAKVRQFAASGQLPGDYVGRLDRFVERVKDMRRPNMVSSRVYSFGGADDVESLQESQLELLAVLAKSEWVISRPLKRQLDVWLDPRSDQYRSIEILRSRLKSWLDRLGQEPGLSVAHIGLFKDRARPGLTPQSAIEHTKAGLLATQQALEERREETLAAQPIDQNRLMEIERFASSMGFSTNKGHFPVHLFPIESTVEALEDFTLTFTQVRRGELTQMQMEQRAVNEEEYFADAMAQQVAIVVLSDVLHRSDIKEVAVQDADAYWRVLKSESQQILTKGGKPILLLDNSTRPDWVWDWQHADFGTKHKRPDDLLVKRREGLGAGYVCDFNDIEIYVAPLPIGQSILISKDAFRSLTFTNFGDSRFVKVKVSELKGTNNLVDLKLTFSRRTEAGDSRAIRLIYAQ